MGIRVLLVDDHAVVREGYRRLIEKHAGIEVVAEADSAASGYTAFKAHSPDVVVIDVSMPGRGGIDLVRQIRQLDSAARILIFSMHASATYAQQAFRAGARGYVTKSSSPEILVSAIRDVYLGRPALCAEINAAILKAAGSGPLKGVLGTTDQPNVSMDFNHDPHSSIFHLDQTKVMDGKLVRVLSWYDNEWGFSNRMSDTAVAMGKLL